MQDKRITLQDVLAAIEQLPDNMTPHSDYWKDAVGVLLDLQGAEREEAAERVAEKFGVTVEEVLAAAEQMAVPPEERLAQDISQVTPDTSDDAIRELCRRIAEIPDELTQSRLIAEMAKRAGKGRGVRELRKIVRQFREQLAQEIQAGASRPALRSIKSYIPDAPVPDQAVMPPRYYISERGEIYWEGKYTELVSPVPVVITRRLHDLDEKVSRVELAYKLNGKWKTTTVSKAVIADNRRIIQLADHDVPVSSANARFLVQYLQALEMENIGHLPEVESVRSMGWRTWNGKLVFVWGRRVIFPGSKQYSAALEVEVDSPGEEQFLSALDIGGTWQGWLEHVFDPAFQYPGLRLGIYAALAAPMLAHCAAQNFAFHYARRTSRGKTTAAQVAMSVAGFPGGPGMPDKPGLYRPWNTTDVGPERIFALFRHLPAYLDDSQEMRRDEQLARILYMFSNGYGRLRGAIRGVQRTAHWRMVLISTGEKTLTEVTKMGGAKVRAIEWTLEPFEGGPIPVHSPELANLADQLKAAAGTHYGHALPRFVLSLMEYGVEKLAQEHLAATQRIREQVRSKLGGTNELIDRLAGSFGAIALAGALFHQLTLPKDHTLAQVSREEVEDFVAEWFARLMDEGQPEHTHVQAYQAVLGWVVSNLESFYNPDKPDREQPHGGWLGQYPYRISGISSELVAIFPNHLQDFLQKYGYPYEAVLREWRDAGWLIPDPDSKHLARQVRFGGRKVRMIVLRLNPDGENTLQETIDTPF